MNDGSLLSALERAIDEAAARYYRLVLLVGPPRSGKTQALRAIADRLECEVVNLNFILSERLLELTKKERALRLGRILVDELDGMAENVVLVDNVELLFDPELSQDPLRLLQGIARNRTVVASWPGSFDETYLTYAVPGHPEWKRYTHPDASIVTCSAESQPPAKSSAKSKLTGAREEE